MPQKTLQIRTVSWNGAKNLRIGRDGRIGCANCRRGRLEVMMAWRWPGQGAKAETEKARSGVDRKRIVQRSNAPCPT